MSRVGELSRYRCSLPELCDRHFALELVVGKADLAGHAVQHAAFPQPRVLRHYGGDTKGVDAQCVKPLLLDAEVFGTWVHHHGGMVGHEQPGHIGKQHAVQVDIPADFLVAAEDHRGGVGRRVGIQIGADHASQIGIGGEKDEVRPMLDDRIVHCGELGPLGGKAGLCHQFPAQPAPCVGEMPAVPVLPAAYWR